MMRGNAKIIPLHHLTYSTYHSLRNSGELTMLKSERNAKLGAGSFAPVVFDLLDRLDDTAQKLAERRERTLPLTPTQ